MSEEFVRKSCIPILYTKGTHYEVGYDIGKTFSGIIQSYLKVVECLPLYLATYATDDGRKCYQDTLNSVKTNFPQYIRELEGTADGANVPFHELFLMHMDDIILSKTEKSYHQPVGCSTICINHKGQEFLGHTEDALASTLNHFYFVSAHIIDNTVENSKWKFKEEKFTSLCYAGHLPGYTMSYNHHGLVFSVNTLSAKILRGGKTPRHFLCRTLLGADNFVVAQQILRDSGCGAGDGCSVNMTFMKQEGDRMFHNAEIGPTTTDNESQLNILTISPGESFYHTNCYLRLKVDECNPYMSDSSVERLKTFNSYKKPKSLDDLKVMLSDRSNSKHDVYRDKIGDFVKTICIGIFDLQQGTWSLYSHAPKDTAPLVVLNLN